MSDRQAEIDIEIDRKLRVLALQSAPDPGLDEGAILIGPFDKVAIAYQIDPIRRLVTIHTTNDLDEPYELVADLDGVLEKWRVE